MARSLAATRRRQLAARAFDDASPALPRHSQASLASPPSPPASLVQCDAAVFRGPMREPVRESRCASRCESRCEKADARDAAASESRGEIRSESSSRPSSRHGDPAGVRAASAAGMTLYHAEPPHRRIAHTNSPDKLGTFLDPRDRSCDKLKACFQLRSVL